MEHLTKIAFNATKGRGNWYQKMLFYLFFDWIIFRKGKYVIEVHDVNAASSSWKWYPPNYQNFCFFQKNLLWLIYFSISKIFSFIIGFQTNQWLKSSTLLMMILLTHIQDGIDNICRWVAMFTEVDQGKVLP